VIATATIGVPIARSYTLTNLFGAFTGRAVGGGSLGSAMRGTPTIANFAKLQFPVVVTAGSTSLRATIGSPSDPAADLDLFVYNCTTGPCVLAGQSADGDSEESVTIANPAAGNWVVEVDGFAVPAGTTSTISMCSSMRRSAAWRSRMRMRCVRQVHRGRCPDRLPPTLRQQQAACCSAQCKSEPTRTY
jgi:hypothetical protein